LVKNNLCFLQFLDAFIDRYQVGFDEEFVFCKGLCICVSLFIATMLFQRTTLFP